MASFGYFRAFIAYLFSVCVTGYTFWGNYFSDCICDFEIQAYLGSGVNKNDSVFFLLFFLHHWLFICHLRKKWSMGGISSTLFFVFSLYICCIKECAWKFQIGLSQKLYFGHHNGKLEIPKSFSVGWSYRIHCSICIQWENGENSKFSNTHKWLLLLGGSIYGE